MVCWTAPTLSPPWLRFCQAERDKPSRPAYELLVTCVLKIDVDFALHIFVHAAGHTDAAGLGNPSRRVPTLTPSP